MHDPMVVAFEIRRPWPQRAGLPPLRSGEPRWRASRGPFWTLAGRRYYWPGLITIWHVEPDERDSGEVCKRYRRTVSSDGSVRTVGSQRWRWHVHHWHVQVRPLQALRRRLLTRCAWCDGSHRKADPVNNSRSWDGERGRWWRGERGLYHAGCMSAYGASRACVCIAPVLERDDYGPCARCGRYRGYNRSAAQLLGDTVMQRCRPGERPSADLLATAKRAYRA